MFFLPVFQYSDFQYHSTIAPYSFIHLPPTPYNIFLPVLQVSPLSINPPLLHTHSSTYHPLCILFFLKVLQFSPCQYHSTIAQYLFIQIPPTLYNVVLPVLQFSPFPNHATITPYSFVYLPPTLHKMFLPVLQFSPVTIIPPLLRTNSSTYHPLCKTFSSSTSVFPCQYHSTIAPYSFIHLPPTLYKIFLSVIQFFPVSIIPPLLHSDSSISTKSV